MLPFWVADMDFAVAPAITEALSQRIAHPVFGYNRTDARLIEAICAWLLRRFDWKVEPESILLVPGVVTGINWAARTFAAASGSMLIQTPVYPPFFQAAKNSASRLVEAPLLHDAGRYEIDFDAFEEKVSQGVSLFLLCNPQNPVGRVFTRSELMRLGEICLRHKVVICSDEIHCDLVFSGHPHVPFAALNDDLAACTVTLMAPSKTFNIPGLHFSFAVVPDAILRRRLTSAGAGIIGHPNLLAEAAAIAAYNECEDWLAQLLSYLQANRDYLAVRLKETIPEIRYQKPEGTYLAWLDCRALQLETDPYTFFLEKAAVALSDGRAFGNEGDGFVRLNFGCPRALLSEAVERMASAVTRK